MKTSRFRRSALAAVVLSVLSASALAADPPEDQTFFAKCQELDQKNDLQGLQRLLSSANSSQRGSYRFLFYRAKVEYGRLEVAAGDAFALSCTQAIKADRRPVLEESSLLAQVIGRLKEARVRALHSSKAHAHQDATWPSVDLHGVDAMSVGQVKDPDDSLLKALKLMLVGDENG